MPYKSQLAWGGGKIFCFFLKILTDFNEAREFGKSEFFQSQPLTSVHGAVLCGFNYTLTDNFVVYCPILQKKYG